MRAHAADTSDILELDFEDVIPNSPAGICACGCGTIVGFILFILFVPATISQLGQWKLGLVKNKVTGSVNLEDAHEPGRYWIGFWKEFVEFPSTLQTIEFSAEGPEEGVRHLSVLQSRDKDGKLIKLDISVQYRLRLNNIANIYKEMLTYYEDIYISELRDSFAKAANLFAVQDIWTNYPSVVKKFKQRCVEVLSRRHAECWGLQLWGVSLSSQYENKVILTQVRKQAAKTELARKDQIQIRAQTQVMEEEYQKNITIVRSGGVAEVYNIEREAYATAQAAFVTAQAKSLILVKNIVCPDYAKNSTQGTCNYSPWVMKPKQLVRYQKMILLKLMNETQLVYSMRGGLQPQAMNVEASRNIMNGRVRRRLLENGKRSPAVATSDMKPVVADLSSLTQTVDELEAVTPWPPAADDPAHEL
jgi:hypothetical protein